MKTKYVAMGFLYLNCLAFADTLDANSTNESEDVKLNDVYIKGSKRAHKKDNEITGLGKVVKNSDTMNKEMVMDIRDLTRYDPGISVVEQGQGASSGYSIRGLDKNRVGLSVDGLPQSQVYVTQKNNTISGAINEIEYENIKAIEISKGASSSEFGSGSLGGSVQMRTKEAGDIIKSGKNWGLDTKTAYSSKNEKLTNSIAFGAAYKKFDILGIYTNRKGKETSIHEDAMKQEISITHPAHYLGDYFIIDGENEVKREFLLSPKNASSQKVPGKKEVLKGKKYTGPDRYAPDEMDYESNSYMVKGGYHFNSQHYLGFVSELTKQKYDIRDMRLPEYWTSGKDRSAERSYDKQYNFNTLANAIIPSFIACEISVEKSNGPKRIFPDSPSS